MRIPDPRNFKAPQYPKKRFTNDRLSDTEKADKKSANEKSIKNLKQRKPHLYKEGWLTEGYKKPGKKDDQRTQRQVDRLDDDSWKAEKGGNMAKSLRKNTQADNVITHHAIRSGGISSNVRDEFKKKAEGEQAQNIRAGGRRRAFGIQPTTRRKVDAKSWTTYENKLKRKM